MFKSWVVYCRIYQRCLIEFDSAQLYLLYPNFPRPSVRTRSRTHNINFCIGPIVLSLDDETSSGVVESYSIFTLRPLRSSECLKATNIKRPLKAFLSPLSTFHLQYISRQVSFICVSADSPSAAILVSSVIPA